MIGLMLWLARIADSPGADPPGADVAQEVLQGQEVAISDFTDTRLQYDRM